MNKREKIPDCLRGYFLISESNMPDPNFHNTVVLLIEHNEEGAFGLVVNRRSHLTLADVMHRYQTKRGASVPIYVGGPVQQEYVFLLHSERPENKLSSTSLNPVPGVYFEPNFREVEDYFDEDYWQSIPADDRPMIHVFLGYSGWAPGQLEREMTLGSWMVHPATQAITFHHDPEQGWRDALRAKGGIYSVFANTNPDPSLN